MRGQLFLKLMGEKCDGMFPCQTCRGAGKRREPVLYTGLPCFDADPKALNYFDSRFLIFRL